MFDDTSRLMQAQHIDGTTIDSGPGQQKTIRLSITLNHPILCWDYALQPIKEVATFTKSRGIIYAYWQQLLYTTLSETGWNGNWYGNTDSHKYRRAQWYIRRCALRQPWNDEENFQQWVPEYRQRHSSPLMPGWWSGGFGPYRQGLNASLPLPGEVVPVYEEPSRRWKEFFSRWMKHFHNMNCKAANDRCLWSFTFILKTGGRDAIVKFCESLQHIMMAVSWGGHESLVIPKCAGIKPEDFDPVNDEHCYIRMYVGLEELITWYRDLEQTLA